MSDHQQGCKLQAPKKDPAPRQDFTSWVAYLHLGETESIRTHYIQVWCTVYSVHQFWPKSKTSIQELVKIINLCHDWVG